MNSDSPLASLRALVAVHSAEQSATLVAGLADLGAEVVGVDDAASAWKLSGGQSFDLAILDLQMPDLDAAALVHNMRSSPRSRHLPIVVVTSADDAAAVEPALSAGASSFVKRPIGSATFGQHVTQLIRLVAATRRERTAAQRTVAMHRAVEAVLGNLAGEAAVGTVWLDGEIERLRQLPLPPDAATMVMHRVNRISRECHALRARAGKAATTIAALAEKVVADDRKESLAAIVAGAVADLSMSEAPSSPAVNIALMAGDTLVACDADGLQQALVHLIHNALMHSKQGRPVCVSAKIYPDGLLGIEVTDHGLGMHPDVLARTFAPLHARLDGSRAGPHMGFGLLFAKAIAEAHGGTLELRSMPNQGTTALLALPPERVFHFEPGELAPAA